MPLSGLVQTERFWHLRIDLNNEVGSFSFRRIYMLSFSFSFILSTLSVSTETEKMVSVDLYSHYQDLSSVRHTLGVKTQDTSYPRHFSTVRLVPIGTRHQCRNFSRISIPVWWTTLWNHVHWPNLSMTAFYNYVLPNLLMLPCSPEVWWWKQVTCE